MQGMRCNLFAVVLFYLSLQLCMSIWVLEGSNGGDQGSGGTDQVRLQGKLSPKVGGPLDFRLYDSDNKWKPKKPNEHKLCLIVAFRESKDPKNNGKGRQVQLDNFIIEMKMQMEKRNVDYTLIVAEQEEGLLFNKGATFNAGFLMSYDKCDYSIFHDVDMIPQSMGNTYEYPQPNPIHLVGSSQHWKMTREHAGGALSMNHGQFLNVGGYSNSFWGWGFEDNDIAHRIAGAGYTFTRLSEEVGNYLVFSHPHRGDENFMKDDQTKVSEGYSLLSKYGHVDHLSDGLRTLNGTLLEVKHDTPSYFHFVYRPHNRKNLLKEEIFHP